MKKKMIALLLSGILLLGSTAWAQEDIAGEDFLSSEEEMIIEEYAPDENPVETIELVDGEAAESQMLADGTVDQEPELLSEEPDSEKESEDSLAGPVYGAYPNMVMAGDTETDNRNAHGYRTWSQVVNSYLVTEETGYMRVEYNGSAVKIQHFDRAYKLLSEGMVTKELSLFGGFFEGADSYYLAFGQTNPAQDDNQEVIRVVRYDKNWNRIGHASLLGANTTIPFEAGSLRMAEYGGYLYVRTCHEMYQSSDGYNHQSSLTFEIRESDMKIVDSQYKVWNISSGYVSHSFNQFIIVDDGGRLVTLDHGDAYPRAAVLCRYPYPAGLEYFVPRNYDSVDAAELIEYYGAIGANYTNATIGGLEYSSTHYLTAGTTGTQQSSDGVRNVYVTCVDRNWSTGYVLLFTDPETNNVNMSNPHLVKLGADSFLLIWAAGEELQYVFLKGDGEAASSIYRAKGTLSDCKPTVDNGAVVWYVTDGTKVVFYKVSADGALTTEVGHLHSYDADMHFEKSQVTVSMVDKEVKNPLSCNGDGEITYSSSDTSVAAVDASGKVTVKGYGSCTITADMKAGVHYAAKTVSYNLTVQKKTKITGLYNSVNGADIRWAAAPGAEGYVIYRKRSAEGTTRVATITNGNTTQCFDPSIKENCWGRVYHYYVKVLSGGKEGPESEMSILQRLAPMKITKAVNVPYQTAEIQWQCTVSDNKALGYELQFAESKEDLFAMKNVIKVGVEGRRNMKSQLHWLDRGKTYYFRVRSYVLYTNSVTGKQTKTWSQYSNVKAVKISR